MEKTRVIQELINLIRSLRNGINNLDATKEKAYELFRNIDTSLDDRAFGIGFPVLLQYFNDPAKKAKTIIQEKEMSMADLLIAHQFIRKSKLAKMMFLSNWYPRSLLVKSAADLLGFMAQNPQYLPKILRGEMVSPMMLEIHPTNATCIYRCRMCIWCGGEKQENPIADFYGAEQLLTGEKWCEILKEARNSGTRKIIFSGGGETLLSQAKVKLVLDKANSLGLETMIYTNGRTLCDNEPTLIDSILNSTWLRISFHAATPEIYSKLINRPLGATDLKFVLDGIRRIINLKKERGSKLRVGIGIVLQELNYYEVPSMMKLCADLEIEFIDVRVDCIGVTNKLSEHQYEHMLSSLRYLRSNVEDGSLGFSVSFADDLLIAMDGWKEIALTQPKRCLIPAVRPAIDPFGIVGACDSIGEPYTRSKSPREYVLGQINTSSSLLDIMRSSAGKELGIRCKFCMPGQISLNALLEKLVDDLKIGIEPCNQPFCFDAN